MLVLACTWCRSAVEAGIFDASFWPRLAMSAAPFAVLLPGVFVAGALASRLLGARWR